MSSSALEENSPISLIAEITSSSVKVMSSSIGMLSSLSILMFVVVMIETDLCHGWELGKIVGTELQQVSYF